MPRPFPKGYEEQKEGGICGRWGNVKMGGRGNWDMLNKIVSNINEKS